jgi:rhodanese-related sulfurtransferase
VTTDGGGSFRPMEPKSPAERIAEARARIRNIDVETAASERDAGALVVDVREADERQHHGFIPGALHVPLAAVGEATDPSSPGYRPEMEPGRKIVFHCAGGGRSALATDLAQQRGFTDVANLEGGFAAWNAAGKPVERS